MGDRHGDVEGEQEGALQHQGLAVTDQAGLGVGFGGDRAELPHRRAGAEVEHVEAGVDDEGDLRAVAVAAAGDEVEGAPAGARVVDDADDAEHEVDGVPGEVALMEIVGGAGGGEIADRAAGEVGQGPGG